ncbi:MAG: 5-methyltetrahydropteroyltriglutamate--homocysteine methyltransferase [Actinomycetota bacterium]
MQELIATTTLGSYPQPDWLIDKTRLVRKGVPRVRAADVWRVAPEHLDEAVEAATRVAVADQEAAGIDLLTDGEIGRESYFNHFATALGGVDPEHLGAGINRNGGHSDVPLVTGPIERTVPVELEAAHLLRATTDRATKVTVPGPFTLSQLAQNEYYPDQRSLAMAYAEAVRLELLDLAAAGIDVVQLDEPYLQANATAARAFALEAVAAAVDGVPATTMLHTCYGYAQYVADKSSGYPFFDELAGFPVDWLAVEMAEPALGTDVLARLSPRKVVMGVLDLSTTTVEAPEAIAARIREALTHRGPDELMVSPDCGMKFLPRAVAQAKMAAMVDGAALVRAELVG